MNQICLDVGSLCEPTQRRCLKITIVYIDTQKIENKSKLDYAHVNVMHSIKQHPHNCLDQRICNQPCYIILDHRDKTGQYDASKQVRC